MENWKKNLVNYLNSQGHQNYKFWNENLYAWCKEWIEEINALNGISANCTYGDSVNNRCYNIEVIRGKHQIPFRASLLFESDEDGRFSLFMSWTSAYDFHKKLQLTFKQDSVDNEETCYQRTSESLTELEICEKGYILELLFLRLKAFMSQIDAQSSLSLY